MTERRHLWAAGTDPQRASTLGLAGPAQGAVEGVGDDPPRRGDGGEEVVDVLVAEQGSDGVVLLAAEPVTAAPGDDVDCVADVEQVRVRGIHPAVGAVGEPCLRECARGPSCRGDRRGPP